MPSLNTGNAILSNPIKVDSSYNVGIGGAASGSFKLQVTGTTNLTGALSGTSATFSAEITSSGSQGRFGGWATGAGYQGNALEVGVSGGIATLLGYNRTSGAYIPLLIGGNTNQTTTIGGNTIVLQNNGVTALTIASTGAATFNNNVGIGITPNTWAGTNTKALQVFRASLAGSDTFGAWLSWNSYYDGVDKYVGAGSAGRYLIEGNEHVFSTAPSGTTGGTITFTERMRITSGGQVQVGSGTFTSANGGLALKGNSGDPYMSWHSDSGTRLGYFQMQTSGNTIIDSTRPVQFSGGNVLIGTTSDDARLTVQPSGSGYGQVINHTNAGSQFFISFRYNGSTIGTITGNNSNVAYNTSSDYRLKQDLKEFKGLDLVSAIKTYDYQWKIDESRMYGVIAHELQEVIPYAVTGEKDGKEMQGVDYSKIVPILVKAIQEQNEIITKQGQAIEELKALINK